MLLTSKPYITLAIIRMLVYVINKNGNPLMPCKPAKAKHLLRDGKAKVIKRTPFTIQLLWDCEENVQPITLGVDAGSKTIGRRNDKRLCLL